MKGIKKYLPYDWREDMPNFWYTVGCYWLDQCEGGSNLLWYIRKTFNYITLNDFLVDIEVTNRLLQLVIVMRQYKKSTLCSSVPTQSPPPSWSDIILVTKCPDAHICNYNWMCTIFMEAEDRHRIHKTMSLAMLPCHTGTIIKPSMRNQETVIKELLVQKIRLNASSRVPLNAT